MIKNELKDTLYPTCPIRNILSRVGDKWSMLVLITLNEHGVMRFNELRRNIPDISQKMLSEVLKALEADASCRERSMPKYRRALNTA